MLQPCYGATVQGSDRGEGNGIVAGGLLHDGGEEGWKRDLRELVLIVRSVCFEKPRIRFTNKRRSQ